MSQTFFGDGDDLEVEKAAILSAAGDWWENQPPGTLSMPTSPEDVATVTELIAIWRSVLEGAAAVVSAPPTDLGERIDWSRRLMAVLADVRVFTDRMLLNLFAAVGKDLTLALMTEADIGLDHLPAYRDAKAAADRLVGHIADDLIESL